MEWNGDLIKCTGGETEVAENFYKTFNGIVHADKAAKLEWVTQLESDGIKAAHPDDGWVNRASHEVQFCYPHFYHNPQIGDKIALGWHDKYRIVVIVSIRQPILFGTLPYYKFTEYK